MALKTFLLLKSYKRLKNCLSSSQGVIFLANSSCGKFPETISWQPPDYLLFCFYTVRMLGIYQNTVLLSDFFCLLAAVGSSINCTPFTFSASCQVLCSSGNFECSLYYYKNEKELHFRRIQYTCHHGYVA